MSDQTLDYFINKSTLQQRDGAEIRWYHAANSQKQITEALQGEK